MDMEMKDQEFTFWTRGLRDKLSVIGYPRAMKEHP
jgi:hypothetical protein